MSGSNPVGTAAKSAKPPRSTWSSAARWTLIVTVLVTAVSVAANRTGITDLFAGMVLVAALGFAVGLLMGSPRTSAAKRGAVGLVVGFFGTIAGTLLSLPIILALETVRLEVPPLLVAIVAGVLGSASGSACAIGSLIGGALRRFKERTSRSPA